jgi:hypothetical protein
MSSHSGLRRAERTTWIHADNAGCGQGLPAGRRRRSAGRRGTGEGRGRRSGRAGEEPGADADTRYTLRRQWRRTRANAAAVTLRTGAGSAARWRTGTDGHRGARRRSHEPTAVRTEHELRWPGSGTTCRAASLDCPGPRAKMYRWRDKAPLPHWVHPSELYHRTGSRSPCNRD